jgi:hypothetical protein
MKIYTQRLTCEYSYYSQFPQNNKSPKASLNGVEFPFNGILFGRKKGSSIMCYRVHESQIHAKTKVPDTKYYMHVTICIKYQGRAIYGNRE